MGSMHSALGAAMSCDSPLAIFQRSGVNSIMSKALGNPPRALLQRKDIKIPAEIFYKG